MVRIPSEYQEVEYLESTGRQYIDLDFGFDPTDEVELRGAMTNVFQDKWLIAPKHWNTDNNRFSMLGGMRSFMFTFGQQGTPNNILSPAMEGDHNFHTVTYANKIYTVVDTGSIADMTTKSFGSTTANIRLFYGYANNTQGKIAYYHHKKQDGTEINLIPCYHKSDNEIGMYDTVSKQFYTNSGTGTFLKGNDVTYDNINLLESRRRILLNTPHIETISDTIASFETDVATKLKECKIHFTPIQEGEGDPSPDNVRPISGWDGITVTKCGKNLVDVEDMKATYPWSSAQYKSYKVYVGPNRNVTVSIGSSPPQGKSFYFGISGVNENSAAFTWMYHKTVPSYNKTSAKVTTNSKGYVFITLYVPNAEGLNDFYTYFLDNSFQVEFGEEATSYEPYVVPTTLTIPFNRTIYGGYVDLVKGEVVEEHDIAATFSQYRQNNGFIAYRTAIISDKNKEYYCNMIDTYGSFSTENMTRNIIQKTRAGGSLFLALDENADVNDLRIVYPLITPNTYPINPQTLKALRGMNNIWSNANGNIEVSFYTH